MKGHYVLLKNIAVIGAPLDIHFKMEPKVMDAAIADLFDMFEQGQIKPEIMATYPLDKIHEAMDIIVIRQVKGKLVLTTGRDQPAELTSSRSSADCYVGRA